MRLDRLLNEVDVFDRPLDARRIEVTNIAERTDDVVPGSFFGCVAGSTHDGHALAAEAVRLGAVALLVERDVDVEVPQVRVPDVRAALAPVAAAFYDHPARQLRVTGITGTNGKTTTTHLLAAILRRHKWKTATIGTLSGQYTSPPAIPLQRMLGELRDEKHNAVVMEVSSHALVQRRVDAIRFAVGVFTNLTQDHLDYHRTMARYFEAKSLLFDPGRLDKAVINIDDSWGRQLVDRLGTPGYPFSLADAENLVVGPSGSTFRWQGEEIQLPLVGQFNVANALAAATAARVQGVSAVEVAEALSTVSPVPGRVERVDGGQPFTVLVDFAHTPDALENVLHVARAAAQAAQPTGARAAAQAAQPTGARAAARTAQPGGGSGRRGQVTVVFGCGGDRDAEKRPLMGAVAEQLADLVVVTSDNPRSESPSSIAEGILGGMARPEAALVELDRARAIRLAVERAYPGDVIVVAGKGHETTQQFSDTTTPFDDRLVVASALEATGGRWSANDQIVADELTTYEPSPSGGDT